MQMLAIRHDTKAWKAQVWISFAIAVGLAATGLAWLPGQDVDRAFMVMGYVFCTCAAFALAKHVRDNETRRIDTPLRGLVVNETRRTDTPLWSLVVWGGFGLAMALTAWGLRHMEINPTYKAYLGVCWLFLISNAFTLAKTMRDAHDAALEEARREGMALRDAREPC